MSKNQQTEVQTPEEKFRAIGKLTQDIEQSFIDLGELLTGIKRAKLHRFKGYERFKDFIEAEYAFGSGLATKLVRVYEMFVEDMDQDEATLKEAGFDRLSSLLPMVKDVDWTLREEWLKKAQELPVPDLKTAIKEARKTAKEEEGVDLKATFVQQYQERMTTWFNCSLKELQFKLALYFQDADLEQVKKVVKERQHRFEEEVENANR